MSAADVEGEAGYRRGVDHVLRLLESTEYELPAELFEQPRVRTPGDLVRTGWLREVEAFRELHAALLADPDPLGLVDSILVGVCATWRYFGGEHGLGLDDLAAARAALLGG